MPYAKRVLPLPLPQPPRLRLCVTREHDLLGTSFRLDAPNQPTFQQYQNLLHANNLSIICQPTQTHPPFSTPWQTT